MELVFEVLGAIGALFPVVAPAVPFISMFVDLLKKVGLPDGYAPLVSLVVNAAFWVLVAATGEVAVDGWLEILTVVMTAVLMLAGTDLVHNIFTKLFNTKFGYSYSNQK